MKRTVSTSFDALVLATVSLASIAVGFWVFRWSGSSSQLAVQVPVALVLGVVVIVAWLRSPRSPARATGAVALLPLALLLDAVLVVGVHRMVTGYWTSIGNVVAAAVVLGVQALVATLAATLVGAGGSSASARR